jgi:hypothetical protein
MKKLIRHEKLIISQEKEIIEKQIKLTLINMQLEL